MYTILDMFTHESEAHMACNFIYLFENKGLLKVTASRIHSKCGNISETVPDSVYVTTDH